jgi:hypothetical protein
MQESAYNGRRGASSGELLAQICEDLALTPHPSVLYPHVRRAATEVFSGWRDYWQTFDTCFHAGTGAGLDQGLVQRCICDAFTCARRAFEVRA